MRQAFSDQVAHQNRFLQLLPTEIYGRLRPHLQLVDLSDEQILYSGGDQPDYLYFPLNTVIYLFSIMKSGATVQIGTVNSESILGMTLLFGAKIFTYHAMALNTGCALRIDIISIKSEFDRSKHFRQMILFYHNFYFAQLVQDVACNRLHSLKMRLSRWLLICQDQLNVDSLKVTQEFLARMLGAQRPYITDNIGWLESEGIVRRRRGYIEILDRQELERSCCECYELYRHECENLQKSLATL